jgi:hypothetical protein
MKSELSLPCLKKPFAALIHSWAIKSTSPYHVFFSTQILMLPSQLRLLFRSDLFALTPTSRVFITFFIIYILGCRSLTPCSYGPASHLVHFPIVCGMPTTLTARFKA